MKVCVTGGSSGIGFACASLYVKNGCDVAIIARTPAKLEEAATRLKALRTSDTRVLFVAANLSDEAETRAAFQQLAEQNFECDLLINSAGTIIPGEFCTMSSEDFNKNIESGFWSVVNPCRAMAPRMKERGSGHIVNVSSVAGYLGIYGYTGYSAAKFGIMGFTEALRFELKPHGVIVSVVCPPDTQTPALDYEKTLRPPETDAAAGTIKALAPEVVAQRIVKGIASGKFHIIPDAQSKLYFYLKGIWPWIFFKTIDSAVKKTQS